MDSEGSATPVTAKDADAKAPVADRGRRSQGGTITVLTSPV